MLSAVIKNRRNHPGKTTNKNMDENHENISDAVVDSESKNSELDFIQTFSECLTCYELFLEYKTQEAQKIAEKSFCKTLYGSMELILSSSVNALGSLEKSEIESTNDILSKALVYIETKRYKYTFKDFIMGPDYDSHSDEMVHAELIYMETLTLKAAIEFFRDSGLINMIRIANMLRISYDVVRKCQTIVEQRTRWANDESRIQFESGVSMAMGVCYLSPFVIPKKYLKMAKFFGLPCDRVLGFELLDRACRLNDNHTLRGPFSVCIQLFYHTQLAYGLGKNEADISYCKSLLELHLKAYPNSKVFYHFIGKIDILQGQFTTAANCLETLRSNVTSLKQANLMSCWDLVWCYSFTRQWTKTLSNLDFIRLNSDWSPAILSYIRAVLLMCNEEDESETKKQEITNLMSKIPKMTKEYFHSYFPMENFTCLKAERYLAQGNILFLPLEELIYVWNYFYIIGENKEILDKTYENIERGLENLDQSSIYYVDNYCLGLLLKGCCLRMLKSPLSAEECFISVCQRESQLHADIHLVAWSLMELAFMQMELNNYSSAETYIKSAKKYKKRIAVGTRMKFRMQAGLMEIEEKLSTFTDSN